MRAPALLIRAIVILLVLLLADKQGRAQSDMDDFKQALGRFLDEERVFLNCSVLDPDMHPIVVGNFDDMVKAALGLLHTYGTPADISEFQKKTSFDALSMQQLKLREVVQFCEKNKGWMEHFNKWEFIVLQNEASEIFYYRHHPSERPKK